MYKPLAGKMTKKNCFLIFFYILNVILENIDWSKNYIKKTKFNNFPYHIVVDRRGLQHCKIFIGYVTGIIFYSQKNI